MNSASLWCMIAALSAASPALAGGFAFESGAHHVGLLELYTSEGCSSCPPAEAWLAKLQNDPALWHKFVPISFHVSYWDKLGWRDRFASKEFTKRQYDYTDAWKSSSVYTPCFILDGSEWHPTRNGDLESDEKPAGRLRIAWNGRDRIKIVFEPAEKTGAFDAYVALLGGGLSSKVTAGENSGEELSHEFVALSMARMPLVDTGESVQTADQEWTANSPAEARRLAMAVWVSRRGAIRPVQATGGWIR